MAAFESKLEISVGVGEQPPTAEPGQYDSPCIALRSDLPPISPFRVPTGILRRSNDPVSRSEALSALGSQFEIRRLPEEGGASTLDTGEPGAETVGILYICRSSTEPE